MNQQKTQLSKLKPVKLVKLKRSRFEIQRNSPKSKLIRFMINLPCQQDHQENTVAILAIEEQ